MSKQEDFHRPEKPREIDNEARISKEAEMKRKFNKNQKSITPWDIQLSSLIFLMRFGIQSDSSSQNSMVTFSVFDRKYPFWVNMVKKNENC